MNGYLLAGAIAFGTTAAVALLLPAARTQVVKAVGLADPDKLGWLDDAELTEADKQRIAQLSGARYTDNLGVIRSIQVGSRSSVSRRDFELLRQDRRRAQAAYPDVKWDDLTGGTWLSVDVSARIPEKFCTSGNSNGTKVGEEWYLDGGCYVGTVRPQYTKRASAADTKRILAEIREAERQKRTAYIAKWGYNTSWGGTSGRVSINAYPDPLPSNVEPSDLNIAGQVVIIVDEATKYQFAFVADDWVKTPSTTEALIKLATERGATPATYSPPPPKPWVRKDGLLAYGESCPAGRLCWSTWNGDGYDNKDIGPADPASWVLEMPFGIAYLPAPDNGETHSDPAKPWFLVIKYHGSAPQVSGGWTEKEAKDLLPKFQTDQSIGMEGQDNAARNWGNLKEARATQVAPQEGLRLADRGMPVRPPKPADPNFVPYYPGMTLAPGQSTSFGFSR